MSDDFKEKALMDQSLKRFEILKSRTLFNFVFERGTRIHGKFLTLLLIRYPFRQIGFTITKSCKTAVKRNYYKRLLREIVRKNKYHFGTYIFILHLKAQTNLTYSDLSNDFMEIIEKYKSFDAQANHCGD